ncbi:MAG: 3'-5' exonuclease [Acinetobacter sp.]
MYCIVDLETTGINQFYDQPVEIGAILINNNFKMVDSFHSYIKISENLRFSDSARKTHGLDEFFLENKPSQQQVLSNFFHKFGTDFRFVAWNMTFDVGFFRRMCFENGYSQYFDSLNYRHIDLQSIFFFYCERRGIRNLFSLDDACRYFGINRSQYHNALEDAEITYRLFNELMQNN